MMDLLAPRWLLDQEFVRGNAITCNMTEKIFSLVPLGREKFSVMSPIHWLKSMLLRAYLYFVIG